MAKAKAGTAGGLVATIERADLLRVLTTTTRTVETRNTYPILANVLLVAEPSALMVRATDLDIEITGSVPANVTVPGSTTVPAKTLLDIVRKFPDMAEVRLEQEGETMHVSAGRSKFKLPTLKPDDFPTITAGTFGEPFTTDIAGLFGKVAFAISNEETRFYLNGIYMHVVGGNLRAVATDGHRLARADGSPCATKFDGVIVPKKTVALLPAGEVQVEVSTTKLRITASGAAGDTVLVSKLIEGTFPDYDRVTPKNNDNLCTLDRAGLQAAVDLVSIVASDRGGRAVKFTSTPDLVTLSVSSAENGDASADVATTNEAAEMVVGYNAAYLADMLRAVGGTTARFAWSDPGAPTVITGDNENWMGVLMPLRVA